MPYPGGKAGAGVYQRIINQIPPHAVYVEPFLGDGAVMRRKLPAARTIGVEIDPDVARRFTLRDPDAESGGERSPIGRAAENGGGARVRSKSTTHAASPGYGTRSAFIWWGR